ncbi:MAG: DUF4249 family protein, partial [Flavobacteriales bacterium]
GIFNLPPSFLKEANACIYTNFNPLSDDNLVGEEGESYKLNIDLDSTKLKATTMIPNSVDLDSVWFEKLGDKDSLGLAWGLLTDPDTLGNAYRWFAKRISHYSDGTQKDLRFIPPNERSVFKDRFANDIQYEFSFYRGSSSVGNKSEEEVEGLFKDSDTIAVKFTSITLESYRFYRTFEEAVDNNGSPFASPKTIQSNIKNGNGVWAGYAPSYDTIYCAAEARRRKEHIKCGIKCYFSCNTRKNSDGEL